MKPWPDLPIREWGPTYATLHLWTQIVGKIRLSLTPRVNQWWNVPFYVTARGLTTSPMPYGDRTFSIDFDLVGHALVIADGDGRTTALPLAARSVADFRREIFAALDELGVHVHIYDRPVEIPFKTPFGADVEHTQYDAAHARRFGEVLRRIEPVFQAFRSRFRGKCSPVHFFWGSFDLAVSRFSGKRAPPREGSVIERYAYDEETISLGFWPGDPWSPSGADAAFYAYAIPEPGGFRRERVRPDAAAYSDTLKEFLLPYDRVRREADPARAILDFAQSTYDAGASLAGWPKESLAYPT
jgi:hypothetical protein